MNNNTSLVSVIMPAYNAAVYIKESIDSLLSQTYSNWELLVINDGSKDETDAIIKSYSDRRIRYFEKENGGVSAARNMGLANMRGDYFCFLDADDQLPENSLEIRAGYMDEQPEVDILDGWVMVMDSEMKQVIKVYGPHYIGKISKFFIRMNEFYFFGINLMIRNKNKPYRFLETMSHAEDLWFYTELAWLNNLNYAFVNDIIYHCRKTDDSAMSNLEGLERGYWQYFNNAKSLPGIKKKELSYLKKRIIRIMFLSYLRRKNIFRAFKTLRRL